MEQKVSERVIGCGITLSNQLGAGFLEAVYANAHAVELTEQGLNYAQEKQLAVFYKQQEVGVYDADFLMEDCLAVESKALPRLTTEHEAQFMNDLRASRKPVGLLLNFGTPKLGIKRIVQGYDDARPI